MKLPRPQLKRGHWVAVGIGAMSVGAGLIFPPAGFIVGGLLTGSVALFAGHD